MTKSKPLNSWEEFENFLAHSRRIVSAQRDFSTGHVSDLIFRGQGDASWGLDTSLETEGFEDVPLSSYHVLLNRTIGPIKGFYPSIVDFDVIRNIDKYEEYIHTDNAFKYMSYMAYLRHFGFPSPLLDWSSSPYVAAFFAFKSPPKNAKEVSIFVFQEYIGEGKSGWGHDGRIEVIESLDRENPRHFAQQGKYSLCLRPFSEDKEKEFYMSHDNYVGGDSLDKNPKQDQLLKVTLPIEERERVLRVLDEMNINSFSLFNNEESLLDTLRARHLYSVLS